MTFLPIAHFIIRRRFFVLCCLLPLTAVVCYTATQLEVNYGLDNILPESDPVMRTHRGYQRDFGNPVQSLVLGITDKRVFELDKFLVLQRCVRRLEQMNGIKGVLSFVNPLQPVKDESRGKIVLKPLYNPPPVTQQALDSLRNIFFSMPLYNGRLYNHDTNALLSVFVFDDEVFFSKAGDRVMEEIFALVKDMEDQTGIEVAYNGLAYFRYLSRTNLGKEIRFFVVVLFSLALCLLMMVFRSFYSIIPAVLLLIMCAPAGISLMVWLGYKITLLSTLLLPIIVIVCVTNYVYFANYYRDALRHLNRQRAIVSATHRVGSMLFFANFTTAVGFLGLSIIDNPAIRQFGIVTGLGVMLSFVLSIVALPLFFSLMPLPFKPRPAETSSILRRLLRGVERLVTCHPKKIIVVTFGLVMLSLVGLFRVRPISYLEDYLSLDHNAKVGLQFVQEHFGGILPLEIIVDTQKKGGVYRPDNMRKIAQLQAILDAQPHLSASTSLVDFFKAGTQAFYNGDSAFYNVPTRANMPFIRRYLANAEDLPVTGQGALTDAAAQKYRISARASNIGSSALSTMIDDIKSRIDALLHDTSLHALTTGTATLLIRQNDYLVGSFVRSMLLAFLVVALSISVLLRRLKLVYISLLTNLIPLCIMVGTIGFTNLKVTPSTILTFTISFGISIDNSIHLLSHYHAERSLFGATRQALVRTIQGVGPNMIQATIILLFSFGFFVFSSFDSIVHFGILISATLVFTILANLIFLPALLIITMPPGKNTTVSGTKS